MILRDLLDLVNKKTRKNHRGISAQKYVVSLGIVAAIGVGAGILFAIKSGKETREDMKNKAVNTVDSIKKTFKKTTEKVKDIEADSEQEIIDVIEDINDKKENVKKDIKNGYNKIAEEANKTAEKITNDINKD